MVTWKRVFSFSTHLFETYTLLKWDMNFIIWEIFIYEQGI